MRVFQIFYKDEQIPKLEESYIPMRNEDCTVFFENSVIRTIAELGGFKGADYAGVIAYCLRDKLGFTKKDWASHDKIANKSGMDFTPESFADECYKHNPDIMSFQRHIGHDPISVAESFHPGFLRFWKKIMGEIGMDWTPTAYPDIFYCNYFIARGEIYEDYVRTMLAPAMDVMKEMPELMANSFYPKPLPADLQKKWGIAHYPFHAFICERFMSFYCHKNKLKALHY